MRARGRPPSSAVNRCRPCQYTSRQVSSSLRHRPRLGIVGLRLPRASGGQPLHPISISVGSSLLPGSSWTTASRQGQPKPYLLSGRRELLRRRGSRGSSADVAALALSATSRAIDDEYQASRVTSFDAALRRHAASAARRASQVLLAPAAVWPRRRHGDIHRQLGPCAWNERQRAESVERTIDVK
jgi:hypothetical protein